MQWTWSFRRRQQEAKPERYSRYLAHQTKGAIDPLCDSSRNITASVCFVTSQGSQLSVGVRGAEERCPAPEFFRAWGQESLISETSFQDGCVDCTRIRSTEKRVKMNWRSDNSPPELHVEFMFMVFSHSCFQKSQLCGAIFGHCFGFGAVWSHVHSRPHPQLQR